MKNIISIMLESLSKYADLIRDGYAIAIYTTEGKVYTYIEGEHELIYG